MNEHLTRGMATYEGGRLVDFQPMPAPPPPAESVWEQLRTASEAAEPMVLVPVGPTGYLDQSSPEDFTSPLTLIYDEHGRLGIALLLVRDDGGRSVEILHKRYVGTDYPVVSATNQVAVVGGPVGPEEVDRFRRLVAGETLPAFGGSRPRWRLAR